jgi:hypothetical protein
VGQPFNFSFERLRGSVVRHICLSETDIGKIRMFRFVFRLAAMVSLSIAVIMAVLDATRTVAASQLVLTPLKTSWNAVSPQTMSAAEIFVREKMAPVLWDIGANWLLSLPGCVVFAGLALAFYAVGYRRERVSGRYVAT